MTQTCLTSKSTVSRRDFVRISSVTGIAGMTGCLGSLGGGEDTVKVGQCNGCGILAVPFRIADDEGFASEYNIEFEYREYPLAIQGLQDMAGGAVDIVDNCASWAFLNTAKDTDVGLLSHLCAWETKIGFITKTGIESGDDLEGKTFATMSGSIWDYMLSKALDEYGVKSDNVSIKSMSAPTDILAAMERGDIDGSWMWLHLYDKAKALDGYHVLAEGPEIAPKTTASWGNIPVSKSWANENLETAANLLRAINKAQEWIVDSPDGAASVAEEYFGQPKNLAMEALPGTEFYLGINEKHIQHFKELQNYAVEIGNVEPYDIGQEIVEGPLKEAFPDKVTWRP